MNKEWQNVSLLALRIIVGVIFVYHGWPKLFTSPELLGLNGFVGFLVGAVEVLFGILLILGTGFPWATYPLMVVILVALAFVQIPGCFAKASLTSGFERDFLILAVLFVLNSFGAGKYAMQKSSVR